jgi:hypothetical protein
MLVFQALAWLHTACVPHVTCPEHGQGQHVAARLQGAPADPVTRTTVAASTAEAEQHDHCGLQHQGRGGVATPHRAFAPAAEHALRVPAPRPTAVPASVISFAPKTSPPRAPA